MAGVKLKDTLDVEKLIISKIIKDRTFGDIADLPSYFFNGEHTRAAIDYLREYYGEMGEIPTERAFKADNPDVKLYEVDEPWADLRKRLENQYLRGVINENMDYFVKAFHDEEDLDAAINFLGVTVAKVHNAVPRSRDVDITQTGHERLEWYRERMENPGTLVGIPTGFPTIDKATQGLQPGQLIVLIGLPKASKSSIVLKMAMNMQEAGKKVLYCTFEQSVEEQARRLDAWRAGFNDNKLTSGHMSTEEWKNLQQGVSITGALPPMIIVQDCNTVTAVGAKADIHEPDVIIIDGMYMMDDENGAERGSPNALSNINHSFKWMASQREIPIIVVTQVNPDRAKGEELNSDSANGSRSYAQYANVLLGIERLGKNDENTFEAHKMRNLRVLISRNCPPVKARLMFDYDTAEFYEIQGFFDENEDDESELDESGINF